MKPYERKENWWTEEIYLFWRECINWLDCARDRRQPNADVLVAAYSIAKKSLMKSIKRSKDGYGRQVNDEVEQDPWGLAYKTGIKKLETFAPLVVRD